MSKAEQEAEMIILKYSEVTFFDGHLNDRTPIECAIIHVEGIINNCESLSRLIFWQEVLTILKYK